MSPFGAKSYTVVLGFKQGFLCRDVVAKVEEWYPDSIMFAAGWSLGGASLTPPVALYRENDDLSAQKATMPRTLKILFQCKSCTTECALRLLTDQISPLPVQQMTWYGIRGCRAHHKLRSLLGVALP